MTTADSRAIDVVAEQLWSAERGIRTTPQITAEWPDLDIPTAYLVQDAVLERRAAAGHRVVGIKLGLTSRAKQVRMGIDQPTVSWLTDDMQLSPYEPVPFSRFIHPRAEPEIAFTTDRELTGPGITAATAFAAVKSVHCAVEIIDSRYRDFKFRIEDTIADNSSSGGFMVNPHGVAPGDVDLLLESVLLEVDGAVIDSATGAAVYGHPAEALAWAVNQLAERDLSLPAGSLVLTGGITDAIPLVPTGSITARFGTLGHLDLTVATEGSAP